METVPQDFINVALIGDGYVGKTCILNCLQKSTYSRESAPNIYSEMTLEKVVENRKIMFKIIDTAGQDEYHHIRKEVYKKAHIFLLCFCVADKVSYENISSKWMPELYPYRSKPIILLGTKVDLRAASPGTSISRERGVRLQRRVGAKFYVECSSKSGEGIPNILESASNVLLSSQSKRSCVVQ